MALTFENDTALHEAGHSMIAYLISDIFEFQYVTSNESFSRAHDCSSIGGLKGKLKKEGDELTFEDCDKMFLLFLAGFIADEINNCNGNIEESFYDNSVWSAKMNSIKYSGDVKNYVPFLYKVQEQFRVNQRDYTKSCQKFLCDIFTTNWILDLLLNVRSLITSANEQTITGQEINQYLDTTSFKSWKNNEWNLMIEARKKEFCIEQPKCSKYNLFC